MMVAQRQFLLYAVSVLFLTVCTLLAFSTSARANSEFLLEMDPTYAGQGAAEQPALTATQDFVRLEDGTFIALGEGTFDYNNRIISVARFTPDGLPDGTFGVNGVVTATDIFDSAVAVAVANDSQGRIVVLVDDVSGSFSTFALLRFLPNGQPDGTFGTEGRIIYDTTLYQTSVYDVAVMSDDRILVLADGVYDPKRLYMFTPTGTLDSSFGMNGVVIADADELWRKLLVESANTIVVAGATNPNFPTMSLWRFTATGARDGTFGDGGSVEGIFTEGSFAYDVVRTLNDTYVLSGYRVGTRGANGFASARLDLDGDLDPTFDGDGRWAYDFQYGSSGAKSVVVDGDGTITMVGSQYQETYLIQLLEDGSFNPAFGTNGISESMWSGFQLPASYVSNGGFSVDQEGNLYIGGVLNHSAIQKLLPTGQPDFSFGARGWAVFGAIRSLKISASAQQPDGKTVLALKIAGDPDSAYVTRVLADGTPDLAFGTNGITQLPLLPAHFSERACSFNFGYDCVQVDFDSQGRILVLVNNGLVRLLPDGTVDSTFATDGVWLGGTKPQMVVQNTGHIVISYAYTEDEVGYTRVIRLLPQGTVDPEFGTNGEVLLNACPDEAIEGKLGLQPDNKILHIGYNCKGPSATIPLYRLTADGQLDATFGTGGSSQVPRFGEVIKPLADGKMLLMGLRYINSQFQPSVMRLNADGSLDATFGTDGVQSVALPANINSVQATHLVLDPQNGILMLGVWEDYTQFPYKSPFAVRLLANGTVDSTFGTDGVQGLPIAYDGFQLTGADRWEDRIVITYLSESSQYYSNRAAFLEGLRFESNEPTPTPTGTLSPTPTATTTPLPSFTPMVTVTATSSPTATATVPVNPSATPTTTPTAKTIFLPLIRH